MAEKVVIVTGGSRGIGAATCRLAAGEGWDVCVNYNSGADEAARVVRDVEAAGRRAVAVQADVSREADIVRLFDEAAAGLGPVTGLVNNAGTTGRISRVDEAAPETIRAVIDLNVTGAMLCARQAVLRMSTRHGGAGGAIVNISSGAATLGSPGEYVWYAASKGAVDSMTRGLALEVAAEGIRVNAVAAGLTDTGIHAAMGQPDRVARMAPQIPLGRAAAPEEIAAGVLWLLSDRASYVTGSVLRIAGGR